MSTGRYSIIDISTDDIHFMQNPAKFPKEVHGKKKQKKWTDIKALFWRRR